MWVYVDVTYLDSGASGTDGDGDGIPEAGETVGLMITAKNFGTGTETGVSITGSVDDEWISDVSGEATINSLPSGGQQLASGVVLIEIESQCTE